MPKTEVPERWLRIDRKKVRDMLAEFSLTETVASHLDLEGFAHIKIIRHGPHECFAQDVTQATLRESLSLEKIERTFWREPAMVKWGKATAKEEKK